MGRASSFCLLLAVAVGVAAAALSGPIHGSAAHLMSVLPHYELVDVPVRAFAEGRALSNLEIEHKLAAHEDEESQHPSSLMANFKAFGLHFDVVLEKNHHLLSPAYTEYRIADGKIVSELSRRDVVNCHYQGFVTNADSVNSENRVRVSTCGGGMSGMIVSHGDVFIIKPVMENSLQSTFNDMSTAIPLFNNGARHTTVRHLMYRAKDAPDQPVFACGVGDHDHSDHPQEHYMPVKAPAATTAAAKTSLQASGPIKYTEVHAVNDYKRFQTKKQDTETHTATLLNMAQGYYNGSTALQYQVVMVLVAQTTWIRPADNVATSPKSVSDTGLDVNAYLTAFTNWLKNNNLNPLYRQRPLGAKFPEDVGVLLSGSDFEASVVGYAHTAAMCSTDSSGINQCDHYTNDAFDSATIAHELGHNFGMCHDPQAGSNVRPGSYCAVLNSTTEAPCLGNANIMSAVSSLSRPASTFSSCSNLDITRFILDNSTGNVPACLGTPSLPNRWGDSICGNGFIDGNETCDCGPYSDCSTAPAPFTDVCCFGVGSPNQCQLKSGAVCSNLQPCCKNCQIIPAANQTTCRADITAPNAECNVVEVCNGTSPICPPDTHLGSDGGRSCPTDVFGNVASWIQDNYLILVVIGIAIVVLAVAYKFGIAAYKMCCGSSDKSKRRGDQYKPKVAADLAGIALPANWIVRYTKDGVPIYINQQTGERYDFRQGPPQQMGARPGGVEMAQH